MKKLIKNLGILGLMVPVISGCTPLRMLTKFNSGKPVIDDQRSIIPFDLKGHMIYVPVRIGDHPKEYNFIFDTGALTMIDEETAKELNLEKGTEMPTLDKTKRAYLTKKRIAISLGDAKVEDFVVPIFDIKSTFGSSFRTDGFIGSDFLRFFRVTIDYKKKVIVISRDADSPDFSSGGYRIKIDKPFPLRFPLVDCKIDDRIEVKGIIDTGCSRGLVIPLSFVEELTDSARRQLIKSKGLITKWPFTEADHNYLSRVESLNLGTMEIRNIPAIYAELPSNGSELLLGKDFLSQFLVTINYPENEMTLLPYEETPLRNNIYSTGLSLKRAENSRIVVKGFWEGSPADRSGIQLGDEILQVNSKSVADFPYRELKDILNDDAIQNVDLLIRSNEIEKRVVLKKEMLLPDVAEK